MSTEIEKGGAPTKAPHPKSDLDTFNLEGSIALSPEEAIIAKEAAHKRLEPPFKQTEVALATLADTRQRFGEMVSTIRTDIRSSVAFLNAVGVKATGGFDPKTNERFLDLDDGTRIVVGPTAETLSQGSVFQKPLHATLRTQTVETQIVRTLVEKSDGAVNEGLALCVAKALVAGLYAHGPDAVILAALAIRRLPVKRRPKIGQLIVKSYIVGGPNGVTRMRQALAGTILATVATDEELLRIAGGLINPKDVLTGLGVKKRHMKAVERADRHIFKDLPRENVAEFAEGLGYARDANFEFRGIHGRVSAQAAAAALSGVIDVPPGFKPWLWRSVQKIVHVKASNFPAFLLTDWASQSEEWLPNMRPDRAIAAAADWAERERPVPAEDSLPLLKGADPDKKGFVGHLFGKDRYVVQLKTVEELHAAGTILRNCLRSMTDTFAERAQAGKAIYVAVYTSRKSTAKSKPGRKPGKLQSVAEINVKGGKIVGLRQHRRFQNQNAHTAEREALREWMDAVSTPKGSQQ